MTAVENVELPMVLAGELSAGERRARAKRLLGRVGMGHRLGHHPQMLSGGEQQRVTVARALANSPPVMLLDEPTGDLDQNNSEVAVKIFADLNAEGVTMIMVTHDLSLVPLASRVVHMLDGRVQRVEEVSEHARREFRARNDAAPAVVRMLSVAKAAEAAAAAAGTAGGGSDAAAVSASAAAAAAAARLVPAQASAAQGRRNTEVRVAAFYAATGARPTA
jgi:ABC-type methionine transport system ATPase subunit